jgi:hypothetical protein
VGVIRHDVPARRQPYEVSPLAAFTSIKIDARTASGSVAHASTISARSGSVRIPSWSK